MVLHRDEGQDPRHYRPRCEGRTEDDLLSGAILIYLAKKTGKLLRASEPGRSEVVQWLKFQMANVGPSIGQVGHFINDSSEKMPYAIQQLRMLLRP